MKKIIALTLTSGILLTGNAYADELIRNTWVSITSTAQELPTKLSETFGSKYDVIIRNNKITPDYTYNSKNYFTKKIKTSDLVIPDEVKNQATKIYFLVEEGSPMMYARLESAKADSIAVEPVEQEYNYKVVAFTPGKEEYVFNSADLVKDFAKDEYKNVTISLVAEFANAEKLYLAQSAYVHMGNKESVLEAYKNESEKNYFWYYDSSSLEVYLEKLGEKMTRNDYKKLLQNSQSRLKTLLNQNNNAKKELLSSITKESDFAQKVDTYTLNTETNNLLSNVTSATQQQLQKIRSYELIDSIFNK